MIKKCKSSDCDTVAEGSPDDVKEVFRFMRKDNCFRSICKKCEYKNYKQKYYIRPSLRGSDYDTI